MEETSLIKLILESNLINFALAFVAIVFFMLNFLPKSSAGRKQELEREIAAAEQAKKDAEQKLKDLEQEIAQAKIESELIIKNAQSTAMSIKDQVINETQKEIERLNANAIREIDLQKTLAISSIKKQISEQAFAITEKNIKAKKDEINQLIQTKVKQELASIK